MSSVIEREIVLVVRERPGVDVDSDVHRLVRGAVAYAEAYGIDMEVEEGADDGSLDG